MSPAKFIKTNLFFSSIALALITSISAFAASDTNILDNGIFLNGDLGASQIKSPDQALPNTTDSSHKKYQFTWGASIGYLYFDTTYQFVGVELGYDHLGKAIYKGTVVNTSNSVQTDLEQYDFDMLFDLGVTTPIGLNLIGKAGIARVSQNLSGQSSQTPDAFTGRDKLTRYVPKAEIGVGYIANSNTDILLNFAHIFGEDSNNFPANSSKIFSNNTLTLSITYVLPQ